MKAALLRPLAKPTPLALAMTSIFLLTNSAHAALAAPILPTSLDQTAPSATLPTITIYGQSQSYLANYNQDDTQEATGLDLTFKETPKSTTVLTQQRLEDQQLDHVKDVVQATPGISIQQLDGSRTQFFARGFEIDDFDVDGLPVSYDTKWGEGSALSSTAIYEQIEVVKGANGLMSGSGNPSATINFTRKQADYKDFSGELAATYDKFGTYGATVDVASKLTQSGKVRGRAIIDYTAGDTYIDREEKANQTAYGVIAADITDQTTLSIGGMHQEKIQDKVMWGGLPIFYTDGSKIDWDTNQSTAVDWGKRDGITDEVFASIDHKLNEDWTFTAHANHAKTEGDMKLFYANGFVYEPNGLLVGGINPTTGAPIPASSSNYIWQTDTTDTTLSAELSGHFEALGQQHQVMVGADYKDYDTSTMANDAASAGPIVGIVNNWDGSNPEPTWGAVSQHEDYTIKEHALYGAIQLQLTDAFGVVLGSRVSNYSKQGNLAGKDFDIQLDSEWTPFAGITYKVTDNSSVFASYSDIFKPQEQRDVVGDYLDPIIGKNYEVGVKATNDTNTLQAQFSVFNIEQDNLAQADVGKLVAGTQIEQAYYAAKGATSTGIDVEVVGQLSNDLQASLGYTQFSAQDAEDKPINTESPDTLIKLFATYDLSDYVPGLSLGGGVNWMNQRYTMFPNPLKNNTKEKIAEDPVTLLNLMAKYEVTDNLEVQVNWDNILNEEYIQSFGFSQITLAEPMNVTGKVSYKW
jgi:outer membrane receptor for ferric coprogen and ferric-rhodotorulic acid